MKSVDWLGIIIAAVIVVFAVTLIAAGVHNLWVYLT